MKKKSFLLFALLIISSCQRENNSTAKENYIIEEKLPLTEEYDWTNIKTENLFGEVLYVPVYSSIYHQSDRTFNLTATLSIHNIDINASITVTKINYYNTNGEFVRSFIDKEFILNPLQSKQFVIKQTDISGGSAAKFVIQWFSGKRVIIPLVEAVMISTSSQQGISFKTNSRIINSIGY